MKAAALLLALLLAISLTSSLEVDQARKAREEEQENIPYIFGEKKSFEHLGRSQHGHFKVLERFSKRSELLTGIGNYRLAVLEAEPRTFLLPSHWDADEVFYVINGRGAINLLWGEKRETCDIEKGDIMRAPAGAIVYLVNNDNEEKLCIAMLLRPISNIPGQFEEFYGAGGKNPESFYKSFSTEILEAAFNTTRDRLERLGQQEKGAMVELSDEQIKALSQHSITGGGGSSSRIPFNVLKKQPTHANRHGELHEADSRDYQELWELNVDVSIANISSGSMMAPNYNSKATKVVLVVGGRGKLEMACPHLSKRGQEEQEERGRTQYQSVKSQLTLGTVIVIPAGHPVVAVASGNENLQLLCFGIRAENNKKVFLAGRNNVWSKMDSKAKELSFGLPAKEVEQILSAQSEIAFLPGPKQQEEAEEAWVM